ncbi:MAG: BTAD domain-containing putative transcriptional regulator [Thermodesulfobacteriota bacterium]
MGDLSMAVESFESQHLWAEKAHSSSLRLFHVAAFSYCLLWQGSLSRVRVLLADGAPLAALPETSVISRVYYTITCGLFYVISGQVEEGRRMLQEVMDNPLFVRLSPPVFYLGYGNLLYALSHGGLIEEIEEIANKLRSRTVVEQCAFHHSYMHFNLGVAYLRTGRPNEALAYSQEAITRGRISGSPIAERMPALLKGQALADLGRDRDALDHLTAWLERWSKAEFNILASAGAIEIAAILSGRGEIDRAREYYERASTFMPHGEEIPLLYRPKEFLERLQSALLPVTDGRNNLAAGAGAIVRVETFGGLRLRIGSTTLYDRKWRGARSKMLLKALIVYGGTNVPSECLADALWPDLDGDRAMKNLKVAITRLRRTGLRSDDRPIHWVVVRHKQVSLSASLCSVDSILFREQLKAAVAADDMDSLSEALDLYTDDFLPRDLEEPWIIQHREALKNDFLRGALLFAELSLKRERESDAIPYLNRAIATDPLHERAYALLMKVHIKRGFPARALKTYHDASASLKAGLAIKPGHALVAIAHEIDGGH